MSATVLHLWPSVPNEKDPVERGPVYMETVMAALHTLKGSDRQVSFEIGMRDGKVGFFIRSSERSSPLIESQLYAQYPDVDIEKLGKEPFATREGEEVLALDLKLKNPEVFPIKRYPQFDDMMSRANVDPLSAMTAALARYPLPGMRGHIQLVVEPMQGPFRKRALRFLPLLERGLPSVWGGYAQLFADIQLARGWRRAVLWPLGILMGGWKMWGIVRKLSAAAATDAKPAPPSNDGQTSRSHEKEDKVAGAKDKVNRLLFLVNVRICVIGPKGQSDLLMQKLQEIASTFQQFSIPTSNGFVSGKLQTLTEVPLGMQVRPYAMSSEEVATLWHVPTSLVQTANLERVISKKLEPPVNLPVPGLTDPEDNLTLLGESVFHGHRMQFGIRPDDRRRHVYIIGKTGMGKSTVLENMIYSDIVGGKGVGVIDPHGDLINAALRFMPKARMNDVILIDPADRDFPIAFNMLECADPAQRPLIASGLMSVFLKLWPEAFSGRMEYILRNTLLALLENEGTSMLGILRMFADDGYRAKIVENVTDPVVNTFWTAEFPSWSDKYRTEALASIQNKVGQLMSTPVMRNIVGQVKSRVNLRQAMDSGKVVLVNLSKGRIGEDVSAFLGSMLVTKFQIDAMSRADVPEKDRRDFYLYVDEFQNFATESFATILSEARKYRLNLTMAHQYVGQLIIGQGNTTLRDAVFGNVGSILSFQVGSDDAEVLSQQFEEMVSQKDILSLPKYHAYVRLMIDGIPSKPFSVGTLPPPKFETAEDRQETVRRLSREQYTEKREVVEEKISRWASGAAAAKIQAVADAKSKEKEEEEMKKARAKKMTLEQYRAWRDKEMWTNEYNALRKKQMLGTPWTPDEEAKFNEYAQKITAAGGTLPPVSKSMVQAAAEALGKPVEEIAAQYGVDMTPLNQVQPAAPVPAPAPKPAPKPRSPGPKKPR